jgi:ABC-type transport system involved in multi-copper enzyme maturation permease subunit
MIAPFVYLDLHQRQRQRSLLVLRIVLLAILAVFTIGTLVIPLFGSDFTNPSSLSDVLVHVFLVLQGVVMFMLAPFGAADRLSRESEQRTLPALLNSPASPASIFFGKLAGAFVFDLFLWSFFLPFIAVNALFCTATPGYIAGMALANLATGFYLSLVALSVSARSKRALHAFLRLGVAYLVWFVFFPILFGILAAIVAAATSGGSEPEFLTVLCFAHNPIAIQIGLLGLFGALSPPWAIAYALAIPVLWLLLSWILVRLALRALVRAP